MPAPEHPTLVLMHNPAALRIEYCVDDGSLHLWWSPKAGQSFDARWRNYSNRDDHLNVFESITLRGLDLERFAGCDYGPYHSVLRYAGQRVHLATVAEHPVILLWGEKPLTVDLKTGRHDSVVRATEHVWEIAREEPAGAFRFVAMTDNMQRAFAHQVVSEQWRRHYLRADLEAGQVLALGADEADTDLKERLKAIVADPAGALAHSQRRVAEDCDEGVWEAPESPASTELRTLTQQSLHSCIDHSGALRASIKAIYYLIWVRDSAFCFGYQAAAGWTHRLEAWVRLLLANPTRFEEPGMPPKLFAQLVSARFGKAEEDGIYYASWSVFTLWTQTGSALAQAPETLTLLTECIDHFDTYTWDDARGLVGGRFADESPVNGARDCGYDHAIGEPTGTEHGFTCDGQMVARSYDIYINLLAHAAWTQVAALLDASEPARATRYRERAAQLWTKLAAFFDGTEALPPYGEMLLESGDRTVAKPLGQSVTAAKSVYVWALTLPTFAPIPGIDGIRRKLLRTLMAEPDGHWINGICATIAALDTWVCPESELVAAIEQITRQSGRSGTFLPMPGAMPEKFDAPQGNLYHDIRPQAFAQSAWLGACANLGVRRLPYGLAVRPSKWLKHLKRYAWRGRRLDFDFACGTERPQLVIDGEPAPHTLQLPEDRLSAETPQIALTEHVHHQPLWLRSTVRLQRCEAVGSGKARYWLTAFGLSEIVFADALDAVSLRPADESMTVTPLPPVNVRSADGLHFIGFEAVGHFVLDIG
ncbi:MAG: hypothetical protein ACFB20_10635 [Opitutales bacterium]